MKKITLNCSLKFNISINQQEYGLEPVFILLKEIQRENNLRVAADKCKYSYRKAWSLLKEWENLLGLSLVIKQKGKGTELSKVGQKLINIVDENTMMFDKELSIISKRANLSLMKLVEQPQGIKIIASDSEKINKLRQHVLPIEIHIDGSEQGLSAYREKLCDIAGFHIARGDKSHEQLDKYSQYLDEKKDQFILLECRQQGLMSHPKKPVNSFQEIVQQQLRFVNRQSGSGTRLLLDSLLKQHGINHGDLKGYQHEEHTHLAVASMIISGQAEVGLGIESIAKRLNLHFSFMRNEYYFLVFRLLNKQIQHVLNVVAEEDGVHIIDYKGVKKIINEK